MQAGEFSSSTEASFPQASFPQASLPQASFPQASRWKNRLHKALPAQSGRSEAASTQSSRSICNIILSPQEAAANSCWVI